MTAPRPILGCDISHYQGIHGMAHGRFDRLHADGIRFVIIRATVGLSIDRAYRANVLRARKRGWAIAAYHYLQPGDIERQAELFAKVIGPKMGGYLDVEQAGLTAAHVRRFEKRFRQLRKRSFLGVYSSRYKWGTLTKNLDAIPLFGRQGCFNALWTEKGTDERSDLPGRPPKARWGGYGEVKLWQYGPFFDDKSLRKFVDGDAWYGSMDELRDLWDGKAAPAPAPDLHDRPGYRLGYNAFVQAALDCVTPLTPPKQVTPAWDLGTREALEDVREAIIDLRLGDEGA